MITRSCRTAGLAAVVFLGSPAYAATQRAATPASPVFVTVFDLRVQPPDQVSSDAPVPMGFPISEIDRDAVSCDEVSTNSLVTKDNLLGFIECALGSSFRGSGTPRATLTQRLLATERIVAHFPTLRSSASSRVISTRGSEILAIVVQNGQKQSVVTYCDDEAKSATDVAVSGRRPTVKVVETERRSQLRNDVDSLLSLGAKFTGAGKDVANPDAAQRVCRSDLRYAIQTAPVPWATAQLIPLTQARARVVFTARLPAEAPTVLSAPDAGSAEAALLRVAEEYLQATELRDREKAEKDDLALMEACPPSGSARFAAITHAACALKATSATERVAAVEALSKASGRERISLIRWAAENISGAARERALVALAEASTGAAATGSGPAAAIEQALSFVSGPSEHWSLGADLFVTKDSTFTRNDAGQIDVDGLPPAFYVSVNFLFGDVLSDRRRWWQNLEVKWMIEGSTSPLDSIGLGVGLRGSHFKRFGLDFEALSPFVGVTWTRSEDSSVQRNRTTRVGVSLDLGRAVAWVK